MKVNIEDIEKAYYTIRKNTKHKEKLFHFEMYYNSNILNIYNMLSYGKYNHGIYNIFLVKEPKYRIIMSEKLNDKIINHYISEKYLRDKIEPKLLEVNVASRKGKGGEAAFNYIVKYLNSIKVNNSVFFILKCDIKKYFYNIDHDVLKEKIIKLGFDNEVNNIVFSFIDSTNNSYINRNLTKVKNEEIRLIKNTNISNKNDVINELENMPLYEYGKGLPIGNMSSQILALYYLNDLDHYIKEQLGIKYYIRYMDDFILIHEDKKYLKKCLVEIRKYLKREKLELNKKTNIYRSDEGFSFIGYFFYIKKKKLLIKIKGINRKRINYKIINMWRFEDKKVISSLMSYKGFFDRSSIYTFKKIVMYGKSKKN